MEITKHEKLENVADKVLGFLNDSNDDYGGLFYCGKHGYLYIECNSQGHWKWDFFNIRELPDEVRKEMEKYD